MSVRSVVKGLVPQKSTIVHLIRINLYSLLVQIMESILAAASLQHDLIQSADKEAVFQILIIART